MEEAWKPPVVRLGDIVYYLRDEDVTRPVAAMVTQVNDNGMVKLNAWVPDAITPQVETGVRHRDDPARRTSRQASFIMFWVHRQEWQEFQRLEDEKKAKPKVGK